MKLRQERYKPKKKRNPILTALMALMIVMLAVMWLNKTRFGLDTGDMLIATGAAVFDTFRHGVFLHPDDVVSQIPTAVPEGKGQHPRNADHILRLAALNLVVESHSLTVPALGILGVNEITLIAFPGIGIGNVEPERSIGTQNAPDFGKHFGQARDIFLRCCLSANLFLHAVVAQRVVRRGCDAAMDALVGQDFQDFETVTNVNFVKLYGDHSFR